MQNRVYFSAGMAAVVVGAHVILTLVVPAVPDNTGGSGTEGDSAYKKKNQKKKSIAESVDAYIIY